MQQQEQQHGGGTRQQQASEPTRHAPDRDLAQAGVEVLPGEAALFTGSASDSDRQGEQHGQQEQQQQRLQEEDAAYDVVLPSVQAGTAPAGAEGVAKEQQQGQAQGVQVVRDEVGQPTEAVSDEGH